LRDHRSIRFTNVVFYFFHLFNIIILSIFFFTLNLEFIFCYVLFSLFLSYFCLYIIRDAWAAGCNKLIACVVDFFFMRLREQEPLERNTSSYGSRRVSKNSFSKLESKCLPFKTGPFSPLIPGKDSLSLPEAKVRISLTLLTFSNLRFPLRKTWCKNSFLRAQKIYSFQHDTFMNNFVIIFIMHSWKMCAEKILNSYIIDWRVKISVSISEKKCIEKYLKKISSKCAK